MENRSSKVGKVKSVNLLPHLLLDADIFFDFRVVLDQSLGGFDFFSQPSKGGGASISLCDQLLRSVGVVARSKLFADNFSVICQQLCLAFVLFNKAFNCRKIPQFVLAHKPHLF